MLRAVLSAWSSILEHFRHPKGNSMPISTSSSLILSPAPLRTFWHLPDSAAAAKPLQSCPTLCDPIDGSPPGSSIPGILQARTLEWVAISFSKAVKWKVKEKSLSRVQLLVTPWTAANQAPPLMGFSRQQYWSGVPLPSPSCNAGEPNSIPGLIPWRKGWQSTPVFLPEESHGQRSLEH